MIRLSTYMKVYKVGDIVDVAVNGAVQKGMPHKYYHGKTGIVYNVTKSSVGVIFYKVVGNRYLEKRVSVRVEHVKHSKCRDDFLRRVKENARKQKETKANGTTVQLKRLPAAPRDARVIKTESNPVETLHAVAYDIERISAPDYVSPPPQKLIPAASSHFIAGGIAGITGALITSPLDVVKTRLQSDFYKDRLATVKLSSNASLPRKALYHFTDTCKMLGEIYKIEGPKALFRGLGPNLAGIVPARSINFFVYGNGKRIISTQFNGGQENAYVHLTSAAIAGIATSTATNPIWLIKTRLQLDRSPTDPSRPLYRNSFDCIKQVLRNEGLSGLYRGMSASYLGVSESTIQWTTYEYFKSLIARRSEIRRQAGLPANTSTETAIEWAGKLGAAATAKLFAAGIAYPHEVVRTRLRQAPRNGSSKYTGLVQCFKLVWKEEGLGALYGGLTAHLMRVVPNAAILFGTYELVINLLQRDATNE
ncbi:protein of unknown function [Taphrina deformans PYCC 5710]|uniref:Mitochondrial carrier protein n=1 Tax=Taphrina deformans (strain PYCC 5710 / ATCC 11124 / CBS 356.35 / IMI 108563 / JCM 9778 / NBRC 8474) TaxID=1097556 RepID=R4XG89_TAPDE|nr:protein of unknown function [Taphrina deformans PYCC 5710]|eukprot:CCG84916.1 protein of unknown function [Taphrina deformans PYCC 5710]